MSLALHCDLCGSPSAKFRCERCYNQLFCRSCDDVFHRHPKRMSHARQPLEDQMVWATDQSRPPLPPKGDTIQNNAPVPPPRRHRMQQPQQQMRRASQFTPRPSIRDVTNQGIFQSGLHVGHYRHMSEGLLSVQENHDEDRPPTPPPISTIPQHPPSMLFRRPLASSQQAIGLQYRGPSMHMSCGNLAASGPQKYELPLPIQRNFPQQHLVQKPMIPRPRILDNKGFNRAGCLSPTNSLQARMSSQESLFHDNWSSLEQQGSRMQSPAQKPPSLHGWRNEDRRNAHNDPRMDTTSRPAVHTLPVSTRPPADWNLPRQQLPIPSRQGFYKQTNGSLLSLNNSEGQQSRAPSRLMAPTPMQQAQSMANLTCPSCQNTTLWGPDPAKIEDRAISVMTQPYVPEDTNIYSQDKQQLMERKKSMPTTKETPAEKHYMRLHSLQQQQQQNSFPPPRRAPSVDIMNEWMPQPKLPPQSSSMHRKFSKSAQRTQQTGRHYARSVPPRSSSEESEEDFYSIGHSDDDFQDTLSFKTLRSRRSRAASQHALTAESNMSLDATAKWQCKFCTFLNAPTAKICVICSKTNVVPKGSHPAMRHRRFKKHIRRSNTDQLLQSKDLLETVSLPPPEKEQSRCSSSLSSDLDTAIDDTAVSKKSIPKNVTSLTPGNKKLDLRPIISTDQGTDPLKLEDAEDLESLDGKVHQLIIHSPTAIVANESTPQPALSPATDSDEGGEIVSGNVTLRTVANAEIQVAGIKEGPAVSHIIQPKQCMSKGTSPPPIEIGTQVQKEFHKGFVLQTQEEDIFYEVSSVLPPRIPIPQATMASHIHKVRDIPVRPQVTSHTMHDNKPSSFAPVGFVPVKETAPWNSMPQNNAKFVVHPLHSSKSPLLPTEPMRQFSINFNGVSVELFALTEKYPTVKREEILEVLEQFGGDQQRADMELAKAQFKPIFMQMMIPRHMESNQNHPISPFSLPYQTVSPIFKDSAMTATVMAKNPTIPVLAPQQPIDKSAGSSSPTALFSDANAEFTEEIFTEKPPEILNFHKPEDAVEYMETTQVIPIEETPLQPVTVKVEVPEILPEPQAEIPEPVVEVLSQEFVMESEHVPDGQVHKANGGSDKAVKPEFERKVRRLLAEGLVRNYKEGEIAARLMELDFSEPNCLQAARECDSLYTAITFLQQSCEICLLKVPISQMVSMLHCTHRCCRSCAKVHFTNCIKERSILEIKCPFCDQPNLQNDDLAQEYFSHLEIILKNTIDDEAFHLYQQKLRDWSLMKDPAFRWCAQWTKEHEDMTCQQFSVLDTKPEDKIHQAELLIEEQLKENGIQCPNCHFRYLLARGGCMHFTCVQCRHEFCSGCDKPFFMGIQCPLKVEFCAKLGLHAHHPRNCLFYLRDKEPALLKKLLKENGVEIKEDAGESLPSQQRKCFITEVRETISGLEEHLCGEDSPEGNAGLCRNHYVEYLGSLIRKNMLDPVSIMSTDDLEVVIRRANQRMPFRSPGETPEEYRPKLLKVIQDHIHLESSDSRSSDSRSTSDLGDKKLSRGLESFLLHTSPSVI
ncbi:unnamed protein product [Notodromas monacha]|uniref:RBR-type E3 ubiquitin transferase n=1 Tax=Notodromas monacha TaxID=399045 RepID=A0A7R9BRG0_9CRUS|nr:unnamed protein product [Notodromas monacha]CAG0918808.1 unnamed protein product [Notodromas monacha]